MNKNIERIKVGDQSIIKTEKVSLFFALLPVFFLMLLLFYNMVFKDGIWFGDYSNQYILLLSALLVVFIGIVKKIPLSIMLKEVVENCKSIFIPVLILFFVGALAGTWLVSGIIPAMVYYGLQILNPSVFLPASVVIAAITSLATGSSWTTSATVGIALVGIGSVLGISPGMISGAVISGAYFGDKMSPLSDTTNLAPAMAGTDLFTHIKYMMYTTFPSIIITLLVFSLLSLTVVSMGEADMDVLLKSISKTFNITPFLFVVPVLVIVMIFCKVKPLLALALGVFLAAVFAFVFQTDVLMGLSTSKTKSIFNAVLSDTSIATENQKLLKLYRSKGMEGMIWTVLLILSAMVFGGVMDGVGALAKITKALLALATSVFGLFASTVLSCIGLNIVASDQYLALVIPGKMFKKAYEDKGLAPENLSRTLEDSGTVTSVLVPWNTCGAFQSDVLGVGVGEYAIYAVFNYVSPIITLIFVALKIKIKRLVK